VVYRWILGCLLGAFISAVLIGEAMASSELVRNIQTHLYAGQTDKAASIARVRLSEVPDDNQARFALGAVQFLLAVEQLGQALHRYGLQSTYVGNFDLIGLPVLRLPVPDNPNPDELAYDVFRNILKAFVSDLKTAEATLSEIDAPEIDLQLNIGLIRLDLNGDGKGSEEEAFWRIFAAVAGAGGWLDEKAAEKLITDFDSSDVPWLQAYCHLLMGIAEFPLAHDWQEAFDATFPSIFHMPKSLAYLKTEEALAEARKRLSEIGGRPPYPSKPATMSRQEWHDSDEWKKYIRKQNIYQFDRDRKKYIAFADLIAFIHLNHWPVIEPERMADALHHLEAMVRLSRENWKRILAETDNNNEWIPNPNQTGVLPQMEVTQARVDGWQKVLDEFEAILNGTKLIPHWRFEEGINMRRMFLEPRTFDIVLLIQGSAALPYLEKGELTNDRTWDQIKTLMGGEFFRYFIWFN